MIEHLKDDVCGKSIAILDDSDFFLMLMEKWLHDTFDDLIVTKYSSYKEFIKNIPFSCNDCFLIDYYLDEGITAPFIIKEIRKYDQDVLIFSISSGFMTDSRMATEEMMKVINAGANRALIKERKSIESALISHFHVRTHCRNQLIPS